MRENPVERRVFLCHFSGTGSALRSLSKGLQEKQVQSGGHLARRRLEAKTVFANPLTEPSRKSNFRQFSAVFCCFLNEITQALRSVSSSRGDRDPFKEFHQGQLAQKVAEAQALKDPLLMTP